MLQDAYPGHAYMTDLPVGVQKAMFSALAPVGRLLDYRADVTLGEEPVGATPA